MIIRWIVRHPRVVLATSALALGAAVWILAVLFRVDSNVEHLFPADDPTLKLTRHLQGDAPPSRALFVVLRGGDLEKRVPAAVDALRGSPHLVSVAATRLDFAGPRVEWVKQSPVPFLPAESLAMLKARLLDRQAEIASGLRRMAEDPLAGKETFLADPLGTRWVFEEAGEKASNRFPARLLPNSPWLIFEDAKVAFLRAVGRRDSYDLAFSRQLVEDVRSRLPEVELAGGYVSAVAQEAAMRKDMEFQTLSSAVLVVAFLAVFTRSFIGAHLLLVPIGLAIVCTLAVGGLVLGPLTPLVVCAAAILVAQGVDFPVHLFARYRAERGSKGHEEAATSAAAALGRPFLGALTTTLAAFLAMLLSRFPGFRQFGLLLFIGLIFCLLVTLYVFPVLLRFIHFGPPRTPSLLRWATTAPVWPAIVLAVVGIGGWGLAIGKGVRVDLDTRHAMPPGDPGQATLARLEKELGFSLNPVFALVPKSIHEEDLRLAGHRMRVPYVGGIADLLPDEHAEERAGIFREDTKGWVEGALADLKSAGLQPEPFRKGLENLDTRLRRPSPTLADLDHPPFADLQRTVIYEDSFVLTILPGTSLWDPAIRAAFDVQGRGALGTSTRFYSAYHLPDHYSRALTEDLLRVSLVTGAAVLILAVLSVGGLLDGLRAIVPVVLATGATLGALTLMGGVLNVMNLVAIPIVVGIGVDGGIHVMAQRRGLVEAGPGIWGSSITTLLGFGSIATSSTPGLASMGVLVAVGSLVSLLTTFFVLPRLGRTSYNPPA